MSYQRPKIAVLGSINMDLVARCTSLPLPGETLTAQTFAEIPGGKGANQALAASRAGADVTMIGRVGDDGFANRLRTNLLANQIDCRHVEVSSQTPSGVAMIVVADSGENQIVVIPGANASITCDDVHRAADTIRTAEMLLLQLEIPIEPVIEAIAIARSAGVKIILDPAPAPNQYPDALLAADLICPNVTEAAALAQMKIDSLDEIEAASRQLHDRGARTVVITLGDSGAALFDGKDFAVVDPYPTQAIDTTAAGDAFAGATAVRWVETGQLISAIRFGNAAGALSASRAGAQPSLPTRREILERIAENQ